MNGTPCLCLLRRREAEAMGSGPRVVLARRSGSRAPVAGRLGCIACTFCGGTSPRPAFPNRRVGTRFIHDPSPGRFTYDGNRHRSGHAAPHRRTGIAPARAVHVDARGRGSDYAHLPLAPQRRRLLGVVLFLELASLDVLGDEVLERSQALEQLVRRNLPIELGRRQEIRGGVDGCSPRNLARIRRRRPFILLLDQLNRIEVDVRVLAALYLVEADVSSPSFQRRKAGRDLFPKRRELAPVVADEHEPRVAGPRAERLDVLDENLGFGHVGTGSPRRTTSAPLPAGGATAFRRGCRARLRG